MNQPEIGLPSVTGHGVQARTLVAQSALRRRGIRAFASAMSWAAVVVGLFVAMAFFDAAVDLASPARIAGTIAIVLCIAALAWRTARAWRIATRDELCAARALDQTGTIAGDPLQSLVSLPIPPNADELAQLLLTRVVDAADRAAVANVPPPRPVTARAVRRPLMLPAAILAATLLATLVGEMLFPGILRIGVLRIAQPTIDTPAWSRSRIELLAEYSDRALLVGDDLRVLARVEGATVPSLRLECSWADGTNAAARAYTVPMQRSERGDFVADLRQLPSDVTLRAVSETGAASAALRISPIDRPRVLGATATITAPAYARRPAMTIDLLQPPAEAVKVLEGSTIELAAIASTDLQPQEGATAQGRTVRRTLTATNAGPAETELPVVSRSGLAAKESVSLAYQVVADQPPRATLDAEPGTPGSIEPNARIALHVKLSDDVLLTGGGLGWALVRAGDPLARPPERFSWTPLLEPSQQAPDIEVACSLDAAALNAQPGDEIVVWAAARDNRMLPGGEDQQESFAPALRLCITDSRVAESGASQPANRSIVQSDRSQVAPSSGAPTSQAEATSIVAAGAGTGTDTSASQQAQVWRNPSEEGPTDQNGSASTQSGIAHLPSGEGAAAADVPGHAVAGTSSDPSATQLIPGISAGNAIEIVAYRAPQNSGRENAARDAAQLADPGFTVLPGVYGEIAARYFSIIAAKERIAK